MSQSSNDPEILIPAFSRRMTLLALALLAAAPLIAAEPEEMSRDAEGAEVQMKGFISDLETLRMSNDPEGLELPKAGPAPAVEESKPAPTVTEEKKTLPPSEPEKPAKASETGDLSRRSTPPKAAASKTEKESSAKSTTAEARPAEKSPAKGSTAAKAPSFPPARVAKDSKGKSDSPVPAQLQNKSARSAAPAVAEKPTDKTPKKTTITDSRDKGSKPATASPPKPATRVASAPPAPSTARTRVEGSRPARLSPNPVLSRGDLTVSLAEGGVAAVRPSDRSPVGARYPASRVSHGSYTVEGTITGLLPRPDGSMRVLVATRTRGTVQVVVTGRYPGETLTPGEHVRLKGERIGGSEEHPVVEIDAPPVSAVPRRAAAVAPDPFSPVDPLDAVAPLPMMDPFPMPGAIGPLGPVGPIGPMGPVGPMGPPPGW